MNAMKVMELCVNGVHLVVKKVADPVNPYRVYRVWWEQGTHREQLNKYADFNSALCFIQQYYQANHEGE